MTGKERKNLKKLKFNNFSLFNNGVGGTNPNCGKNLKGTFKTKKGECINVPIRKGPHGHLKERTPVDISPNNMLGNMSEGRFPRPSPKPSNFLNYYMNAINENDIVISKDCEIHGNRKKAVGDNSQSKNAKVGGFSQQIHKMVIDDDNNDQGSSEFTDSDDDMYSEDINSIEEIEKKKRRRSSNNSLPTEHNKGQRISDKYFSSHTPKNTYNNQSNTSNR